MQDYFGNGVVLRQDEFLGNGVALRQENFLGGVNKRKVGRPRKTRKSVKKSVKSRKVRKVGRPRKSVKKSMKSRKSVKKSMKSRKSVKKSVKSRKSRKVGRPRGSGVVVREESFIGTGANKWTKCVVNAYNQLKQIVPQFSMGIAKFSHMLSKPDKKGNLKCEEFRAPPRRRKDGRITMGVAYWRAKVQKETAYPVSNLRRYNKAELIKFYNDGIIPAWSRQLIKMKKSRKTKKQ